MLHLILKLRGAEQVILGGKEAVCELFFFFFLLC